MTECLEKIFENSIPDPQKRFFVPCQRVIACDKCSNAEVLPNSHVLQNFTNSCYPYCTIQAGGYVVLDFGKELSGGVRLVTGLMKPCKVRLRFGESVAEACGEPNMDHAVHDYTLDLTLLSAGDYGSTGFRFVRIDALDSELLLVNCIAVASLADQQKIGSFKSSDALLDRIFNVSAHTVHLCIQNYVLDGIKRDRLLWAGDMHPEVLAIQAVFGSVPQVEATLEKLCFDTVSGSFVNGHTSYSLWTIMTLHDVWFYDGNDAILKKFQSYITNTVERYRQMIRPDGSVDFPGHVFLDWPSHGDNVAIYGGCYALLITALQKAVSIYEVLQLDTTLIKDALKLLAKNIPPVGNNKSAAALQHLTGLIDRSDILEKDPFSGITTFIGCYVLFAKENRKALELLKKYWGGMLAMGATSFWEDFDLAWLAEDPQKLDEMPIANRKNIHSDFGGYCYQGLRHSLCHGWAAGPAMWLQRQILGVTPKTPGFTEITFNPDLCGLEFAEGAIPTPHGVITVRLEKDKAPQISLPDNIKIIK